MYVSNFRQGSSDWNEIGSHPHAQVFTTGSVRRGYTLTGIDFISRDPQNDDFSVALWSTDSGGDPSSSLFSLTPPASFAAARLQFTSSSTMRLLPSTKYALVISRIGSGDPRLSSTTSPSEDAGAGAGWSIENHLDLGGSGSTWSNDTRGENYRINVRAEISTEVIVPDKVTDLQAARDGLSINLSWTEPEDTGGSPITGYKIEASPDGATWQTLAASHPGTTYEHAGLTPGVPWNYRVTPINVVGEGQVSDSATPPLGSETRLSVLSLSPKDIVNFRGGHNNYTVGVHYTVRTVTITATPRDPNAKVVITPGDYFLDRPGHQVFSQGPPIRIEVTAEDGVNTRNYRVDVNRGTPPRYFSWRPNRDFDGLKQAGNHAPTGLWSDGTTMWVSEDWGRKIFAYRMSDGTRDGSKDIQLSASNIRRVSRASGRTGPPCGQWTSISTRSSPTGCTREHAALTWTSTIWRGGEGAASNVPRASGRTGPPCGCPTTTTVGFTPTRCRTGPGTPRRISTPEV